MLVLLPQFGCKRLRLSLCVRMKDADAAGCHAQSHADQLLVEGVAVPRAPCPMSMRQSPWSTTPADQSEGGYTVVPLL